MLPMQNALEILMLTIERETNCTWPMVVSRLRAKNMVMARRLTVWACREFTDMSFMEIALLMFGKNNHVAVHGQYQDAMRLIAEGDAEFVRITQVIGEEMRKAEKK